MAGLLSSMLMGPAQRLMQPTAQMAAPMAQASQGGLLAQFNPQIANNRFYQAFDRNRDTLVNTLLGGVGAESPLERMRGMAGGAMQGRETARLLESERRKQEQAQQQFNATLQAMQKAGRDDLVMAVQGGLPITEAWKQFLKPVGSDGPEAPSSVREWEHFNSLPPEDQARYLRMKRANPYLDIGTGFVQPDPVTPGQVAGPEIIKENYQEKFDQAQGAEEGKRAGEMPIMRSKALSSMDALDNQRSVVEDDIGRAIADIQSNPNMTTGLIGGLSSAVPGSPAFLLAKKLETIKANVGFDKLQSMRENSPTGGALGQVSDFENRQLQAVFGNLEQAQTAEQLLYNLQRLQQILAESKDARRRAFARDFGDLPGTQLPPPAPSTQQQRFKFNPATGELE